MFIPHTESERKEMLAAIGVEKIEDLFAAIPEKRRFPKLGLLKGMTEMEASAQLREMAEANLSLSNASCFLGAGAYYHYIPAAVDMLVSAANSIPPTRLTSRKSPRARCRAFSSISPSSPA